MYSKDKSAMRVIIKKKEKKKNPSEALFRALYYRIRLFQPRRKKKWEIPVQFMCVESDCPCVAHELHVISVWGGTPQKLKGLFICLFPLFLSDFYNKQSIEDSLA